MPTDLLRALTMQQPYAAAMAAGVGLFSRRGKVANFPPGGEWLAIHCGQNNEHIDNEAKMAKIRKHWPGCPSDQELRAGQKSILGLALFTESVPATQPPASTDPLLSMYDCSKPVAWSASKSVALDSPVSYPSGQVQIWKTKGEKFGEAGGKAKLEALLKQAKGGGGVRKVKKEEEGEEEALVEEKAPTKRKVAVKKEVKKEVKPAKKSRRRSKR
jgi:hypothetical protein